MPLFWHCIPTVLKLIIHLNGIKIWKTYLSSIKKVDVNNFNKNYQNCEKAKNCGNTVLKVKIL